jgi:hypothetical protein
VSGEPATTERFESRWPVVLAVIFLLALLALLPSRLIVMPSWVPYVIAVIMLVPLAAVELSGHGLRWLRVERVVLLTAAIFGIGLNTATIARLVHSMLFQPDAIAPITLLTSSVAAWVGNVVLFALLYWLTDRGGPDARESGRSGESDYLFTQVANPQSASADWSPGFVDYFSLAFNTSTAFSPTDTLPLTPRGKILMIVQSSISLVTLVVVAARAINVLK